MPLETPNLDDRSFQDLLDEARSRISALCPAWTDLGRSDPGMVLLELFAHLTEVMIYRLNRVPEKAYVEFLKLMGVKLLPPSAARVTLRFELAVGQERKVEIPRGTRVTLGRAAGSSEPPVFVTARTVSLDSQHSATEVLAHHAELIEGELVGTGTGLSGQSVSVRRPPIIASSGDELDLVVGVEMESNTPDDRAPSREYAGKAYRVWREVENFTDLGDDSFVYVSDRMSGVITFAPAVHLRSGDGGLESGSQALAAAPESGREIRVWYRRGGGPSGNVGAGLLTVLKDPVPGVSVTNPRAALGGRAAEELENALVRGPQELHSLKRAVTARDFELVATRAGAVKRARAFTQAKLWAHAPRGSVEVLLVPALPEEEGAVTRERLAEAATEEVRAHVQAALDERRPLGTSCKVGWARCKSVAVTARVVIHREEDPAAVKKRVLGRLHKTLNPLSSWPFGQALRASHVYDIVLAEPGVKFVDQVSLQVEEAPEKNAGALAEDAHQSRTWYAGAQESVYRSFDDGDGWELIARFPTEQIRAVVSHDTEPGLLAVASSLPSGGARLHLTADCGESFRPRVLELAFNIEDLAWITREGTPILLVATSKGLYELAALREGAAPVQVLVDPKDHDVGFYAVTAARTARGALNVAVASYRTDGVFLSVDGGLPKTFHPIGLKGEDVRVLAVMREGPRSFLWAGVAAAGGAPGKGCFQWELRDQADSPGGWQSLAKGWEGGSCTALAFSSAGAYAGSHQAGVLRLDLGKPDPIWRAPNVDCGLPLRDVERLLYRIESLAARSGEEAGGGGDLVIASGPLGTYRSRDGGLTFESCSRRSFTERVSLPSTWLFCSGEHRITVVNEDEAY